MLSRSGLASTLCAAQNRLLSHGQHSLRLSLSIEQVSCSQDLLSSDAEAGGPLGSCIHPPTPQKEKICGIRTHSIAISGFCRPWLQNARFLRWKMNSVSVTEKSSAGTIQQTLQDETPQQKPGLLTATSLLMAGNSNTVSYFFQDVVTNRQCGFSCDASSVEERHTPELMYDVMSSNQTYDPNEGTWWQSVSWISHPQPLEVLITIEWDHLFEVTVCKL